MRIVFATGNKDKMREIRQILGSLGMEVVSMKEADADVDVEENGTTFAENSMIKARAVAKCLSDKGDHDSIVLADDSGLEIDYLNGEPGIYSARYLGKDTPYPEKNSVIISRLDGVKDEERSARFVCAISAVLPDGKELSTLGKMEGRIGRGSRGAFSFPYQIRRKHAGKAAEEGTPGGYRARLICGS